MKESKAGSSFSVRSSRALLCLMFACLLINEGYTQNKMDEQKMAPAFRSLIEKNKLTHVSPKKKCIFSRKTTKKMASANGDLDTKYDCIVYTKNAEAVRRKGIIVNSALPTFVTAEATLQQIMQMSLMKEVTYIDAPATDVINH